MRGRGREDDGRERNAVFPSCVGNEDTRIESPMVSHSAQGALPVHSPTEPPSRCLPRSFVSSGRVHFIDDALRMRTLAFTATALAAVAVLVQGASYPLPFTRSLSLGSTGTDVYILQNLLGRQSGVTPIANTTTYFGPETQALLEHFQTANKLAATGVLDVTSATLVLAQLSEDGYKDDGRPPSALGYKYKIYVPVHRNRSIETNATLIHGNGTALFTFRVRAHGFCEPGVCSNVWPSFNSQTDGLNEFSSNGNTPTGLAEADLNSPEDDPKDFGPYPVNRMVSGLLGNAGFLVPSVRNGILVHTGEWSQYSNWQPPMNMPNSEGCIHSWPTFINSVWNILVNDCGVTVNQNTGGSLPYPYKPQGLLSVELID